MPESPSMKSTVNSSIGPTSAKKFEMQIAESSVKCMVGDTRPDPHRLDDLVVLNICRSRRWLGVAVGLALAVSRGVAAEWYSFQAGSGGWHLGTLAVENLDEDPAPEIIVPYRDNSGR